MATRVLLDLYVCVENNLDPDRYREFLKNPSLFTRTPPQQ